MKFADPISVAKLSQFANVMYVASWDKMIRAVDMEQGKVVKSFVASKESINCVHVTQTHIFVAGCDPIIRGFNLETGECKLYEGHKGWVYALECYNNEWLVSGSDDRTIIIWSIDSTKILETLGGHENGVTSLAFAFGDLYSGSYDHHVICWDMPDIEERIKEK